MTDEERIEIKFIRHWDEYRRLAKLVPCPVERALYHLDLAINMLEARRLAKEDEVKKAAVAEAERIIEDAQQKTLPR